MTRLLEVADAAAERIGSWLPELAVCKAHAGPFGRGELERLGTATPAVYLTLTATTANDAVGDGRQDVTAEYAASILTTARGADAPAGRLGVAIGEALLARTPCEQWGLTDLGGAVDVRLRNEFSAALADHGVALWVVSWRQQVRLGAELEGDLRLVRELCVVARGDGPAPLPVPEAAP